MNKKRIFQGICLSTILLSLSVTAQPLPKLEVSSNHRYLVQVDGTKEGKPFFYLGDTAWELFTRLSKGEIEKYFQFRKTQGFNVILASSHNEIGTINSEEYGVEYPNREGFKPFASGKLFTPEGVVEDYWKHVDWVIDKANDYGIYIALLPYIGNRYVQKERSGTINSTDMAYNWGYYLGNRYKNKTNIIWTMGGDCEPFDYKTKTFDKDEYDIFIATAEGVADGINSAKKQYDQGKADYSTSMMTYHINVGLSSSKYFHDADFLDFNGMQSGQNMEGTACNYNMVTEDYNRVPIKPTIDLESLYEFGMRKNEKTNKWEYPVCSAFEVRRNAYRSILAGAMGFNYGNNNVWMFYKKNQNYDDRYMPSDEWDSSEGIYSDGAKQMQFVKKLFLSRPFYNCNPSNDLITDTFGRIVVQTHIQASLENDHEYAVIYVPTGQVFNVDLTKVSGNIACWWYNPINGAICDQKGVEMKANKAFQIIPQKKRTKSYQFVSPTNQDWVLVLDDASKKLPSPGSIK